MSSNLVHVDGSTYAKNKHFKQGRRLKRKPLYDYITCCQGNSRSSVAVRSCTEHSLLQSCYRYRHKVGCLTWERA